MSPWITGYCRLIPALSARARHLLPPWPVPYALSTRWKLHSGEIARFTSSQIAEGWGQS